MWRNGVARGGLGRALWLACALALSACGKGVLTPPTDHGEFAPYLAAFLDYSRRHGRDTHGDEGIRIAFGELDDSEAGRCEWNFWTGRRVLIDERRWKSLREQDREALMLHELGHCLLGRGHDAREVQHGAVPEGRAESEPYEKAPRSLMYATSVPGDLYERFKDYYLRELFGRDPVESASR